MESPPQEDSSYLMRVYDTRTWEMYRRITESRRNSQYTYSKDKESRTQRRPTEEETPSEWENLHENAEAEGGHEMVFLFDFE